LIKISNYLDNHKSISITRKFIYEGNKERWMNGEILKYKENKIVINISNIEYFDDTNLYLKLSEKTKRVFSIEKYDNIETTKILSYLRIVLRKLKINHIFN